MTASLGIEPRPHWWEESALNYEYDFFKAGFSPVTPIVLPELLSRLVSNKERQWLWEGYLFKIPKS